MRTKTLLMAVAALAAGIITSNAQVYSQNIVGYATMAYSAQYTLMTTPFSVGVSNGANEIFGANLEDGMTFLIYNGLSYDQTMYSPLYQSAFSLPSPWMDPNEFTNKPIPTLPPGMAYFLYSPDAGTNVASGAVAVNVGATNTMNLPAQYSLVGSVIPLGGSVTNTLFNAPLEDGTTFLTYNGLSYDQTMYSPLYQSAFSLPSPWMDPNEFTNLPPPSITVGEGFFIYEPDPQTWTQTLPAN